LLCCVEESVLVNCQSQKLKFFVREKGSAFCMPCVSDISLMEDGRHRSIVIYSVAYRFPRASPMPTTFVQF
jgi:hypothetical protein